MHTLYTVFIQKARANCIYVDVQAALYMYEYIKLVDLKRNAKPHSTQRTKRTQVHIQNPFTALFNMYTMTMLFLHTLPRLHINVI